MPSTQIYRYDELIGYGGYSVVYQAEEVNSGQQVALKTSRVSQRVKRPILQYESRVLQLIQGHPAIPTIYGYGQLPHFEYIALELLGPSVRDRTKQGPVSVTTAVRVVLQVLSALEHIHNHGFVHRDIKPQNLLCSSTDPSKIVLIDFGISLPIQPGPSSRRDLSCVIGTLEWASLNAHDGIDLGPRDDLESLAYVAFFLLRGNLPWIVSKSFTESYKASMRRTRASKSALSGVELGAGFPAEFGYLLDYSRSLGYDQIPDYAELKRQFTHLNRGSWSENSEGPLDWSALSILASHEHNIPESDGDGDDDDDVHNDTYNEEDNFSNSYFGCDCGDWDIQGERDRNLTLPIEQVEMADSSDIPRIVEVTLGR